jgi:hypothetical protein
MCTILNPSFQGVIQFFLLLGNLSTIILGYNSIIFPYWLKMTRIRYRIAPTTTGSFTLLSNLLIGLCLIGICGSIFILLHSTSNFVLNLIQEISKFMWLLFSMAVFFLLMDVFREVLFLLYLPPSYIRHCIAR